MIIRRRRAAWRFRRRSHDAVGRAAFSVVSLALAFLAGLTVYGLNALDRAFPPPLDAGLSVSQELRDADGQLLRAFATADGRWRLKVAVEDVDPQFIRMLVAYEDQRFFAHRGIDHLVLGRATMQLVTNGRIVSGASTLSMQVARLIEPRRLSSGEAALLVALPQLPERRLDLPAHAPHLAELARRLQPHEKTHQKTLRLAVQRNPESVAREAAKRLGPKVSVAMMMADVKSGEIIAEVGSSDYLDTARRGFIDMTRAVRSPGSTLRPFIYSLAFEEGLIAQETVIEDRPADFSGYGPRNFDMRYQGDVTIREALQLSLNVPAVRLLDAVGATALTMRFRRAVVAPQFPAGEAPGLAVALGGAGVTLADLMRLYAALANRGEPVPLADGIRPAPETKDAIPMFDAVSVWQTADILSGVVPPASVRRRGIAWKTGTSYGYRDAWSIRFNGCYVPGVWAGRADNGAVPGLSGYGAAAPILFEAFNRAGVAHVPLPSPPPGAVRLSQQDPPPARRRFAASHGGLKSALVREDAPRIVYPPEGAHVELSGHAEDSPLVLKLQGGRAPFRWLANGRPLPELSRRLVSEWLPDGEGYSTLTVIDSAGRAASVRVVVNRAASGPGP